jgi:DNA-binding MarR family transcriptional regulator
VSNEIRASVIGQLNEAIRQSQNLTDAFDQFVADSMGINRTDYRCMDILERGGPMTAGRLAEAAHLSTGAVTAVLDRMEAHGIVTRVRDTEDRRRVMVEITPQAREQAAVYFQGVAEFASKLYEGYTTDQLQVVLDLLRRGNEMMSAHMGRMKAQAADPEPSVEQPT